jgi:hypothetical protein
MSAVITKKQKNTIMVLGGIAAVVGTIAGASGLLLREKYLVYDQNWDVDIISGFTEGYFGVMSGFIVSSLSIYEKKNQVLKLIADHSQSVITGFSSYFLVIVTWNSGLWSCLLKNVVFGKYISSKLYHQHILLDSEKDPG